MRPLRRQKSSLKSPFPAEVRRKQRLDNRKPASPDEPLLKCTRLGNRSGALSSLRACGYQQKRLTLLEPDLAKPARLIRLASPPSTSSRLLPYHHPRQYPRASSQLPDIAPEERSSRTARADERPLTEGSRTLDGRVAAATRRGRSYEVTTWVCVRYEQPDREEPGKRREREVTESERRRRRAGCLEEGVLRAHTKCASARCCENALSARTRRAERTSSRKYSPTSLRVGCAMNVSANAQRAMSCHDNAKIPGLTPG